MASDDGKKIILTALSIVVAFVFLFVVYRYVLCLAINHVTAIRRADQQTERFEADRPPVQSEEPSYTGLDPAIIASLPVYVYQQTDQTENNGKRDCVVCLSSFEKEEIAIFLPNCKHMFHSQCINMWFSSHTTCPICRCGAEPRVVPELKEKRVGWLPFAPVDLDFFHPITPSSEGTSDGSAQDSKVGGVDSPPYSFGRLVGGEWRQIRGGISSLRPNRWSRSGSERQ